MKIDLKKGDALSQNADVVINSANNFLFHRTGSAAKIRIKSGKINKNERKEFDKLVNLLDNEARDFFNDKFKGKYDPYYYASLSAMKIISGRNKPFSLGEAVLDKEWSRKINIPAIHLILVKHIYKNSKHAVVKCTKNILKKSLINAFKIISERGYKSVAIPVMVARGMYGLTPKESYGTIFKSLKYLEKISSVERVVICFDNENTKNFFDKLRK